MEAVRITSLNPKFNGSHFGLPPSGIQRMTGWVAISRILWRMRTAPISVCTTVKFSPDSVLFVLYEEKSPIPRSKQTPVEHSSLPPLALPYHRTFCTTFRVHHTTFAVSALFLKFRGFRGFRIFFFYHIISVSKHVFSGSPELRTDQNWLYV